MRIDRLGLIAAALAAGACLSLPASAGDMYRQPGSIKDAPMMMSSVGPCYWRGDVGYSWSNDPDVKWTVTDPNPGPTQWQFVTERVTNVQIENTWFGETGFGCGSGPRGIRGELVYGYHGKRNIDGEPGPWNPATTPATADPLHTSVTTHTLMFNGYYDLGKWDRVVPYVGAGVGFAYNKMDEVYFTGNPALVNRIEGDDKWSLAWSLMAGIGWQISERAMLDFGYRYLDMGKATSGRIDTAGFTNPPVRIDDLTAHEFKIGLRYYFGGGEAPHMMK
jgi:opacity protein-like surface antigen